MKWNALAAPPFITRSLKRIATQNVRHSRPAKIYGHFAGTKTECWYTIHLVQDILFYCIKLNDHVDEINLLIFSNDDVRLCIEEMTVVFGILSNYHFIIDSNFTGLPYDAWAEQTNRQKFMCAALDKEHDLKWVERPCFHKSGYICQYGKDSQYLILVKVKFVKWSTYLQANHALLCSK